MSSIPYNYGSYIDAKVAMTDTGHVSASKQIQSPASAGSRGLAKTTQFTNDRTQMQMGNSPIAESMIEIRTILNRIDGVNVPVQEEATIKPYISMYKGKDGKQVYDVLDKNEKSAYKTSDERLAQHFFKKNYNKLREAELDEGIQEWGKRLAMAGIIVAGLAGVNSINNAIDNSVPAVKAMNTALEMAQDSGNDELAKMIEKDLSDAKVRLSSGKDLGSVADLQDKYAKFMKTEGLAYESKLAVNLKQQLK